MRGVEDSRNGESEHFIGANTAAKATMRIMFLFIYSNYKLIHFLLVIKLILEFDRIMLQNIILSEEHYFYFLLHIIQKLNSLKWYMNKIQMNKAQFK